MKCLVNGKDVKHPCSSACALFGDCVTAFSNPKEEKSQPTTNPLHEGLTANDKLAYEQFKLQWMIDHGFTLKDLIKCMEDMIDEDLQGSDVPTSLQSLFEDWEFGIGFAGGQVWPCFEEFLEMKG